LTNLIPQNDVVDAAFDGAGAPVHGQAVGDGVEVLLQALGERRDAGQAGGAGVADPLREVLAGELGDHDSERPDLAGGGLQLGAAFEDGIEPGPVVLGEGVRVAGDPAGDVPDGRRGRRQRFLSGPAPAEVVADDGIAAGVAALPDLPE
jgi:hypothetical protein